MTRTRLLNVLMIGVALTLISAYSASATYNRSTKSEPAAKSGCCSASEAKEAGDADETRASNQKTKAAFANSKCPIMGGAIDPANVTPELTREYKGQKIAFCCGGCPGQWDKLSDQEKEAKLRDAR